MRRTDVLLSAGTLGLVFFAMVAVVATGSTSEVIAWAWERHHNVLSWYIRPLFLLPFCFFAYKRSLWGMTLTLLALATSMFWFPAPGEASTAVKEMLGAEREYLTANWTPWKVLMASVVPATFAALGLAFWKRSLVYGLVVINAAVLIKVGWTFVFGTAAGAMSHLPAAVLGLVICDVLVLYAIRRLRAGPTEPPRPAGHHG
jgi:hypothetical protein